MNINIPWTPPKQCNIKVLTNKIWVITPKPEGCGFPCSMTISLLASDVESGTGMKKKAWCSAAALQTFDD